MIAIAVPTASATSDSPSAGKPVGSEGATLQAAGKAVPVSTPDEGKRSIDVRADTGADPVDPASPTATAALRGSLGSQGVLDIDPNTGTPRFLGRLDGFLTGPSSSSPQDVALGYARANAKALGLSTSDLGGLRLTRNYTDTSRDHASDLGAVGRRRGGVRERPLRERHQGRAPDQPDGLAGRGPRRIRSLDPDLSARNALATALDNARRRPVSAGGAQHERRRPADRVRRLRQRPAGPVHRRGWQHAARLGGEREGLLDRDLRVRRRRDSGKVLLRQNTVDFAAGNVWEYAPNINAVCPRVLGRRRARSRCTRSRRAGARRPPSSRATTPTSTRTSTTTTFPTPRTATARSAARSARARGTNWNYAFQANPNPSALSDNCFTIFPQCSWSIIERGYGWRPNLQQNATQVYFYVNNFHDWLAGAPFGFTAAAGNFEGDGRRQRRDPRRAATDTSPARSPARRTSTTSTTRT